jgi:hypothetical protein
MPSKISVDGVLTGMVIVSGELGCRRSFLRGGETDQTSGDEGLIGGVDGDSLAVDGPLISGGTSMLACTLYHRYLPG